MSSVHYPGTMATRIDSYSAEGVFSTQTTLFPSEKIRSPSIVVQVHSRDRQGTTDTQELPECHFEFWAYNRAPVEPPTNNTPKVFLTQARCIGVYSRPEQLISFAVGVTHPAS